MLVAEEKGGEGRRRRRRRGGSGGSHIGKGREVRLGCSTTYYQEAKRRLEEVCHCVMMSRIYPRIRYRCGKR